jgi:hypothetical protein
MLSHAHIAMENDMTKAEADEVPSTEQQLKEAADKDDRTPAEQAVVNQDEAFKSGEENPT